MLMPYKCTQVLVHEIPEPVVQFKATRGAGAASAAASGAGGASAVVVESGSGAASPSAVESGCDAASAGGSGSALRAQRQSICSESARVETETKGHVNTHPKNLKISGPQVY